ncbi:MAG TPA: patatin-like phospholipase family protein [Gammaproteobacteria bacterium]
MADKSDAASQGHGPAPSPDLDAGKKFDDVLLDELGFVATRRGLLKAERGEFASTASGDDNTPLKMAWRARLLGLSFSGGGIRSATFNLGVLQSLARCGVLRYVDYLSTVSGGGYIGSWLTALSQRRFARTEEDAKRANVVDTSSLLKFNADGFRSFEKGLAWSAGDSGRAGPDREDLAIRFLREFSNYLTPQLGMFSGDTWALIAIYLRNALLNQLVLLLALIAVLLAPRLLSASVGSLQADELSEFLWWMAVALVMYLCTCWHLGKNLAGVTVPRPSGAEPTPRAPQASKAQQPRDGAPQVILLIGMPLLAIGISGASWLGYLGPWLAAISGGDPNTPTDLRTWAAAAVVGALLNVVTWVLALIAAWRSGRRGGVERTFWTTMIKYSPVAGAVFGVLLHAAGLWLFTSDVYSGYKLLAAPPALALAILLAGVLHVGLAGQDVSAQYSEWISRFGGLMMIGAFGWIAFNGLVLLGPLLVAWLKGLWEAAVSSGWLLTTIASVVFGRNVVASSGKLPRLFMAVAPWIFIIGLGVALAALLQAGLHLGVVTLGADAQQIAAETAKDAFYFHLERGDARIAELMTDYGRWLQSTEWSVLVAITIVIAFLLTWWLSLHVDINLFSLNGMYANRLVRCYLGASVTERTPNKFSGLSARDDLQLHVERRSVGELNMLVHPLADGETAGGAPGPGPTVYPGPYHLVNTAINLVAGGNLAYQERKAGAFLLSPLYCGFQLDSSSSEGPTSEAIDSYRPTAEFSSRPRALTLGEAVATSGAAASPNMGYHTTPAFAFLMGLLNIRLGRWVGNPYSKTQKEKKIWLRSGPRAALLPLLSEVFGLTDKDSSYVYLSDGGHFENLGIYELVRRRCRYIIACDAGADERYGFEDLGNAIRKCRTDLGVEIDLDVRQIASIDAQKYNAAPCAVGSIRYSEEDVGTILYIKATRRAGLPSDVMHYATEHLAFPHESTADQFFSESQFESYRRLGHFLAGDILGSSRAIERDGVDIDRLFRDLSERWYRPSNAIAANFGRLAEHVDELFERLRTSEKLTYLSRQFYPEWRDLLREKVDPNAQAKDLVSVPTDEEQVRQGFYFCNSLIQLMESAYVGLGLDAEWRHPDNSGWLNVFNHWAWSGMFRVTWAISAATYGGRFRAFCEQHLNLTLGDVEAKLVPTDKESDKAFAAAGFNAHELHQIADPYVRGDKGASVYRLELLVRHPILDENEEPLMTFGFGYAVMRGDELVMYRVQDHLRGMGLGRRGLVALVQKRDRRKLTFAPREVDKLLGFFVTYNEQTDRAKLADFRAMVVSVNEEEAKR